MDQNFNPLPHKNHLHQFGSKDSYTILYDQLQNRATDKLCLFASFSFTGFVADYVLYYLEQIKNEGYAIAFVSTSNIQDECLQKLQQSCSLIIERKNQGLDFASWQCALKVCDWGKEFDTILLANDSVFGPFQNLGSIIKSMNKRFDIWGMTDNYDIDYHIQSYFLHFNEKVIKSEYWLNFWMNMDTTGLPKDEIIRRYEVGLSKLFSRLGFRLGVHTSIDVLIRSASGNDKDISPPLVYWKTLIEKFNFPFLKRELLINKNISKAYWHKDIYISTATWRNVILQNTGYEIQLVDSFLSSYYQELINKNPRIRIRNKKILFLVTNTSDCDAQKVFLSFLKWMKSNTKISFEVLVATSSDNMALMDDLANVCAITQFWRLSEFEKLELKDRLSSESVGLIFSNTLENIDLQQFLSFLQVPQVIYVHEWSDQAVKSSDAKTNKYWLKENIDHFIVYSTSVMDGLKRYVQLPDKHFSIVPAFIDEFPATKAAVSKKAFLHRLNLPSDTFLIGILGTPDHNASLSLVPSIATMLCKKHKNIHFIWLGIDVKSAQFSFLDNDMRKAEIQDQIHYISRDEHYENYYGALDVFLMLSKEDNLPLASLEVGSKGVPVIGFESTNDSSEYKRLGVVTFVPYLDLGALRDAILDYYQNRTQQKLDAENTRTVINNNFGAKVQAPKLFSAILTHFDQQEFIAVEQPSITLMTHIFYDNTWKELKYKLNFFKEVNTQFLFSISEACLIKEELEKEIRESFPEAYIITTSNIGKDIGGKFALIDLYLSLKMESDFIIFLHDKQSPHSLIGDSWKNNLQKVVDFKNYQQILKTFEQDEQVGVVGAKEHLISEYDITNNTFLNNNDRIHIFLKKYNLTIKNYEFFGGTMYWMRAGIIENFFTRYNPMQIRSELEAGNVLDNHGSTNAHTWERVLSWVASSQGYKLFGI